MNEMDERFPMESFDPASKDPGFWIRFHNRVMAEAQTELARRRMTGDLSVADVVFAWRKALVPAALLAAALAGILIMGHEPGMSMQTVALEEVLTEDLSLLDRSGVLSGEGAAQLGIFAALEGEF
ncbi:MAG: hypothetical protein ACQET1_03190 [Gemmatimonadota bacterium]